MTHLQKCSIAKEENIKINSNIVQVNPWEKVFPSRNLNLKIKIIFSMKNPPWKFKNSNAKKKSIQKMKWNIRKMLRNNITSLSPKMKTHRTILNNSKNMNKIIRKETSSTVRKKYKTNWKKNLMTMNREEMKNINQCWTSRNKTYHSSSKWLKLIPRTMCYWMALCIYHWIVWYQFFNQL